MKINLPSFMMKHLPPGTNFHLIAGTYNSVAREDISQAGTTITKVSLHFRSYPGQEFQFNGIEEIRVGTVDPSAFQTMDNRLVLGLVDHPGTGFHAVTMWVPDASAGQYTVEQAYFFLAPWLVSKAQKNMQLRQIAGGVTIGTALGMLAPGPVGGFLAKKFIEGPFLRKIQEQDRNGERLDMITTPRLIRDFGHWLMENGYFLQALELAQPSADRKGGPL